MGDRPVVVFDVDDTLYLERDYVRSGFDAVGRWLETHHGVRDAATVFWARFERGERGHIFDGGLDDLGVTGDDALVRDLVEVYRSHTPNIGLLDDARACLDAVAPVADLAVITDGPVASQRAKIAALGLERWVPLLVVTGEHGPEFGKPADAAYVAVESHFEVPPSRCAYVADNPAKDFVAPHRRGWRTVRVRRDGSLHHAVDCDPPVDHEVPDLADVPRLLGLGSGAG
jgi:putative hydrolase of the HAD superfamily